MPLFHAKRFAFVHMITDDLGHWTGNRRTATRVPFADAGGDAICMTFDDVLLHFMLAESPNSLSG